MPISASVGSGGKNSKVDVEYVQALLNYWQRKSNRLPIKVDGIVGPKTIAAIQDYQRAKTGWVDGRVDPGGRALRSLEAEAEPLIREMQAYIALGAVLSIEPESYSDIPGRPPVFSGTFFEQLLKQIAEAAK